MLAANIRQELGGSAFPITLSDCNWSVANAQVAADLRDNLVLGVAALCRLRMDILRGEPVRRAARG